MLALLPVTAAIAGEQPAATDLEKRVKALEDGQAAALRFGIVAESEVLDCIEEKKDIDADIEKIEMAARQELLPFQKVCQAYEDEIALRAPGSKERVEKEKELEKKKQELTVKYRSLNADVQQKAKQKIDDLRRKIRETIAKYAKDHGYSLVIERNALLFGEEAKSLTTEVIDQMNDEYFKIKIEKKEERKSEASNQEPAPAKPGKEQPGTTTESTDSKNAPGK